MIKETARLRFREYTDDDFGWLYELLSDEETMKHYPKPYDEEGTRRWIRWNLDNYKRYGHGLWVLELKENDEAVGDCGITMQPIDDQELPEIGYHLKKEYWRRGLAKEAAAAVRDWAFTNTLYEALYSYMNDTNTASAATARAIGMRKVKEYTGKDGIRYQVYRIEKSEWEKDRDEAVCDNEDRRICG